MLLLRSFQPIHPLEGNVRLEAPTVQSGAQALLDAVAYIAAGNILADYIGGDDSVEVMYFSEDNFPARTPHVTM